MPTNYDQLRENKKSTLANIKTYIASEKIDTKERHGELVEQIKDQELGPDLVLKLEEMRDLALGVTWKQYQKADGSYDLIRDCTKQSSDEINTGKAEQISFAIQSANLLIGAKKVLEIEGKVDDGKLLVLLSDQLSKLKSGTSIVGPFVKTQNQTL